MAVVKLVEDANGDLILPLDDEIFADLGWEVGDTVVWKDLGNGSWSISKKEEPVVETEYVLVECVSTFRERYMVEVPKGKAEWALDTVTMEEAKEFSQEHLGEQIVSYRVVDKDEIIKICDVDNDYTKSWTDEMKFTNFVTSWEEQKK